MDRASQFLEHPVFISGFNKSGTTLLLSLLDNHTQLVVLPEELHFFQNVLCAKSKLREIMENTGFRMFLEDKYLRHWSKGKSWFRHGYPKHDKTRFRKLIETVVNKHRGPRDLLLGLVQAFAEVDGVDMCQKEGWVSKTTQDEMFFPLILKMFGKNCRYFYVVRDPRDVCTSYKKRDSIIETANNPGLKSLLGFITMWKTQVNRALHYQRTYKNFDIFKYEDIVVKTEEIMRRISRKIGIKYSECLLRPTRHGRAWAGNSVYSDDFDGLSLEPIGRYKTKLGIKGRALIERTLSDEMVALGYGHFTEGVKKIRKSAGSGVLQVPCHEKVVLSKIQTQAKVFAVKIHV